MTKYEPRPRNGLESPDYDEMLAAYLTLVDQHCLHLVPVPASSSVPVIPGHIDNRAVYNSWAGEYVVDYEAWVNNFPSKPSIPFTGPVLDNLEVTVNLSNFET